jgi:predicted O-methyltransferase YrrM
VSDSRAMDVCHADLIYGAAISAKPANILELGIGTGMVTERLLNAIAYNGIGKLTSVDNLVDDANWPRIEYDGLKARGANVVLSDEWEFVCCTKNSTFDFLVSDADHGGKWFDSHSRICAPGALMFFHDTATPSYPGLYSIEPKVKALGWPCIHFKKSSRTDERCERGLLMVVNGK